jgi:hypothetical protein
VLLAEVVVFYRRVLFSHFPIPWDLVYYHYGNRQLTVATEAAAASFPVTSEAWYNGWRAWVDGQELPLVPTNVAFRGLAVPAGRHTVRSRKENQSGPLINAECADSIRVFNRRSSPFTGGHSFFFSF